MAARKDKKISPSELVTRMAEVAGLEKGEAGRALNAFKQVVTKAVRKGETVDMGREFGKFTVIEIQARKHFIPSKGKMVKVGMRHRVRFRPTGQDLKDLD